MCSTSSSYVSFNYSSCFCCIVYQSVLLLICCNFFIVKLFKLVWFKSYSLKTYWAVCFCVIVLCSPNTVPMNYTYYNYFSCYFISSSKLLLKLHNCGCWFVTPLGSKYTLWPIDILVTSLKLSLFCHHNQYNINIT